MEFHSSTTSHATPFRPTSPSISLASSIRRCVHEDQTRLSLESTARIAWKLGQYLRNKRGEKSTHRIYLEVQVLVQKRKEE
nr:hypothetical protein CFP56_49293 [Quercus suber]